MSKIVILICLYNFVCSDYVRYFGLFVPTFYEITTELDDDSFKTNKFKGQTKIQLTTPNSSTDISINCIDITITKVELNSTEEENPAFLKVEYNHFLELATLKFNSTIKENVVYQLSLSYTGRLNDKSPRGIYKTWYKSKNGTKHYLVATHFESTWASKAFPCFDLPKLKAVFLQHLIYPKKYSSWSNNKLVHLEDLPNSLVKASFLETARMSTFLVAFVIADFTCISLPEYEVIRVCSRLDNLEDGHYALELTVKLLFFFFGYTKIHFTKYGIEKLDLIAVPNFLIGFDLKGRGVGNNGLAIFSEDALLYSEVKSSVLNKQRIAYEIAHQVASMWFGGGTTAVDWRHNFLNVGFASYVGLLALNEVDKDLKAIHEFNIKLREVLSWDKIGGVPDGLPPLSLKTNSLKELRRQVVCTSSHIKGAGVLRMFVNCVGQDRFKDAVQYFLQTKFLQTAWMHEFNDPPGSTYPDKQYTYNFFASFIVRWITQPGYPFMRVSLKNTDVIVEQENYAYFGKDLFLWYVPLTYSTPQEGNFTVGNPEAVTMYKPYQPKINISNVIKTEDDWIIFNNQQMSYFRVMYSNDIYENIFKAWKKNPNSIHAINRAEIIDDLFSLVRLHTIQYSQLFQSLDVLNYEQDYYVWKSALNNFDQVMNAIYDRDIRQKLLGYIEKLMDNLITQFEKTDGTGYLYKVTQVLVLEWMCIFKKKFCMEFADSSFNIFKKGFEYQNIDPNLGSIIFCTVLTNSDKKESDFQFLWNVYVESYHPAEKDAILKGLTCVNDDKMLETLLNHTIEGIEIRQQNMILVFSLLADNRNAIDGARDFIAKNFQKIMDSCHEYLIEVYLTRVLVKFFKRESHITEFVETVKTQNLSSFAKTVLNTALAFAHDKMHYIEQTEYEINTYFTKSIAESTIFYTILIIICICVNKLIN